MIEAIAIEYILATLLGLSALSYMGVEIYWERQQPKQIPQTPAPEDAGVPVVKAPPQESLASRFFAGLARSRNALAEGLARAFGGETIDEEALEGLEDALIRADVGVKTAMHLTEVLRDRAERGAGPDELRALLRDEMRSRIGDREPLATVDEGPLVILVVGVNGSGKTTTIGKLANRFRSEGRSVLLAAGDTFRAGAIEQLKVWGERADVPVVAQQEGSSPAAVIFDALEAAQARNAEVVICDTAGRLQTQRTLMDELAKVNRVIKRSIPDAPHEVLLVLDATIGQNALSQARTFKEVTGVTGVALTKMDGTAKGGVVLAVKEEIGVPVKLVGLGEGIDDLRDFDPDAFVDALTGTGGDAGAVG
ncbi:MAG: signal recognition particle-docking protein FtsY [Myxococcota bacterium]